MSADIHLKPAHEIAAAVNTRRVTARAITEAAIAHIEATNAKLGAFTDPTFDRALAEADAVDASIAAGKSLPLAGVPYAVKNLFDIEGVTTRAGSKINRDNPPAKADAFLIARMKAAGAVLLGGLNMGEYAYDFTGENAHDGASLNPHDPTRMSGGSSGGSGTAVAAGMVAASLGSDTNGSIRVPSSFCGLFGLKPTFGRLSRGGSFPFCASLDHLGPIARSARDLALTFDALQAEDPDDPAQVARPFLATAAELDKGMADLRIAVAGGYFRERGEQASLRRRRCACRGARRHAHGGDTGSGAGARRRLSHHHRQILGAASVTSPHARRRLRSGRARPADLRRLRAGILGAPGTALPRLVPRRDAQGLR